MLPSSGHSNPATDRRIVVLPDPEGPKRINTVDASTGYRIRARIGARPGNVLTIWMSISAAMLPKRCD